MPSPCPICRVDGQHKMDCPNRGATFNDRQRVAPELACGDCLHLRIRPGGAPRCMRHGVQLTVWCGDVRRAEVCLRMDGREL